MLRLFRRLWDKLLDDLAAIDEAAAHAQRRYEVVPAEKTELAQYFAIKDRRTGEIVAGPTFYRRMVEECAALNRSR